MSMFSRLVGYYDAIYYKAETYQRESEVVSGLIRKYKQTQNNRLLDVACGTGTHIKHFLDEYQVSGLDLSTEMLELAGKQYPGIDFFNGSMIDFENTRRFGSIICLYGSIGFVQTVANLIKTMSTFSKHMDKGGMLILTPWSCKEHFTEHVVSDRVRRDGIQIARMEKVERLGEDIVP